MEAYAYQVKMVSLDPLDETPVGIHSGTGVYPRLNFNTFGHALVAVFALLVNEDWNYVLYTYIQCGSSKALAYAYIGFVVVFGNFFLLQLFLAILIDNFGEASEEATNKEKEAQEEEEERKLKEVEERQKNPEKAALENAERKKAGG
jgi:hypothetical protein